MAEQGFTLTSQEFRNDELMPPVMICDGQNTSPELNWIHAPQGTRSFALIVDDPDAPNGTFSHWVLYDIPANAEKLPGNATGIGTNGRNDFQQDGYGGPCPPPNHGQHRYYFKLYALDVDSLDLPSGAKREEVLQAIQGHILGQTELMGRYERTTG